VSVLSAERDHAQVLLIRALRQVAHSAWQSSCSSPLAAGR
jgi:hypothetical protein